MTSYVCSMYIKYEYFAHTSVEHKHLLIVWMCVYVWWIEGIAFAWQDGAE